MFWPDCICVCSFSMTSPSWIRSCLTLMPVISANALASVLRLVVVGVDGLRDDLDVHALERLGGRLMNHFISSICWSLRQRRGLELAVDPLAVAASPHWRRTMPGIAAPCAEAAAPGSSAACSAIWSSVVMCLPFVRVASRLGRSAGLPRLQRCTLSRTITTERRRRR